MLSDSELLKLIEQRQLDKIRFPPDRMLYYTIVAGRNPELRRDKTFIRLIETNSAWIAYSDGDCMSKHCVKLNGFFSLETFSEVRKNVTRIFRDPESYGF